jgi:hypothetical protein
MVTSLVPSEVQKRRSNLPEPNFELAYLHFLSVLSASLVYNRDILDVLYIQKQRYLCAKRHSPLNERTVALENRYKQLNTDA